MRTRDRRLTGGEFTNGSMKWFDTWNIAKTGVLSDEELRAGINRDFAPPARAPPEFPV